MPGLLGRCLTLFLAAILPACATTGKGPVTGAAPTAEELLHILKDRNASVTSLSGKMAGKVTNSAGKRSTTQLVIFQKPNRLRMDTLSPFGNPILTTATDGERIDVYYHG